MLKMFGAIEFHAAFGKYMSDVTKVIRVMKKLRSLTELQLFIDSFSEK